MTTDLENPPWAGLRQTITAFIRVDVIDDLSYPLAFVISQVAIFIPVITSYFVGELASGSPRADDFGGDYFTFAVLGLALAASMQGALTGFGFALQKAQERGTFETLLVEPLPWTLLPIAMNIWQVILAFANGLAVVFVGWLLGANYRLEGFPTFLILMILGVLSSVSVGMFASSFLVLAKKSRPFILLYGLGASIFAGTVFSVAQLPAVLRIISWIVPHTYVVNAARAQLMSQPITFSIPLDMAFTYLGVFNIVTMGLGIWLFHRCLRYGRAMGILSGY
jgi:ABC-2 type transport system permease protein